MRITFNAAGLSLEAEVDYEPGWPGSHWEPPEPDWCEITELTCCGLAADFLLESTLVEEIEIAALNAASETAKALRDEARIERYIDRVVELD
jgi:hypothetical protein